MNDVDDVGGNFLFGGIFMGLIFLILYLVVPKPEIDKCEEAGGMSVKSNSGLVCVDKNALIDTNKKGKP